MKGHGISQIARTLQISHGTVRTALHAGSPTVPRIERAEKAEPYRDQILAWVERQRAKQVVWNQLTPLRAEVIDELRWHFEQARAYTAPSRCNDLDERFCQAREPSQHRASRHSTGCRSRTARRPGARGARIGRSQRCGNRSFRPGRDP
jgi:hypothetical protein